MHALLAVMAHLWRERLDRLGGRTSIDQITACAAIIGCRVLAMLVRGLGYLQPVDATREDLLHGILSADEELVPATTAATATPW